MLEKLAKALPREEYRCSWLTPAGWAGTVD
jgi:hypothetical protein